jgi:hypothetical protein
MGVWEPVKETENGRFAPDFLQRTPDKVSGLGNDYFSTYRYLILPL